jgi:hypothetical protein
MSGAPYLVYYILCVLKTQRAVKGQCYTYITHAVSLSNCAGMNYSTAGFELVLTRKMSFYIITYYLPSGLFVVVSWIRCSNHKINKGKSDLASFEGDTSVN